MKKDAALNAWRVRCLRTSWLPVGTEQTGLKVGFYPPASLVGSSLCVLLSILPEFAMLDGKERGVKGSVINYLALFPVPLGCQ